MASAVDCMQFPFFNSFFAQVDIEERRNRKMVPIAYMVPIAALFYCGALLAIENGTPQLKRFYTSP